MRMLVLGAGLQGTACAYRLLQDPRVETVTLADREPARMPRFLTASPNPKLAVVALDATDEPAAARLMAKHDAAMCALPYYFNEPMTRSAISSGCHFADLGGNTGIVIRQEQFGPDAERCGVSVIPDCGLAPGMVNILVAEGIRRLEQTRSVRVYVGGLPRHPEPPLNYQIVYSLEGALDYYTTPSWILRGGKAVEVDALSEVETQDFPEPIGTLEAFHTGGGISTLPFRHEHAIDVMEYKTLRYPGHAAVMRPIRDLGLLATTAIEVKGHMVIPRDVFIATVAPRLCKPDSEDLVALRVLVRGTRDGREVGVRFELVDWYDREIGMSAMMRTTGFSLALTGLMQAGGEIPPGVLTPDRAVPFRSYVEGLAASGVHIREQAE